MDQATFNVLFELLKKLEEAIDLPNSGEQSIHDAYGIGMPNESFKLIINRKGHRNPDNLTFQLTSRHGIIIRFDISGASHMNANGEEIETPHVHIFSPEYDFGKCAITLAEITDVDLLVDIYSHLEYFLKHNNFKEFHINQKLFDK